MKISKAFAVLLCSLLLFGVMIVNAASGTIKDTFETTNGPAQEMKLELYKTDDNGVSTEKIAETRTSFSGRFEFTGLASGVYNIKIDTKRYAFINDDDKTEYEKYQGIAVVVDETSPTPATVIKKPIFKVLEGDVLLTKTQTGTDDRFIEGATYKIYDVENPTEVVSTRTTNVDGQLHFWNLPYGQYIIKESEAAPGYFLNLEEKSVTVDSDEINVNVTDDKICKVTLIKKDYDTNDFVENAVYELYKKGVVDELVGTYTTNEEGKIEVEVKEGEYYFKETTAPDGYKLDESEHPFTLDAVNKDTVTVNVKDKKMQFNIKVSKVDKITKEGLPDAKLQLVKVTDNGEEIIETWTSDGNPKYIGDLTTGQYKIKELETPEGYKPLANDYEFEITKNTTDDYNNNEDFLNITIENEGKDVNLGIIKVNEGGEPLANAELRLEENGQEILTWISTDRPTNDANYKYIPVKYGGTYTLKELTAPTGYSLLEDITIKIDKNFTNAMKLKAEADGVEWDGIYRVEVMNYEHLPHNIKIKKTDEAGNPLAGAKLGLYDKDNKEIKTWVTTTEPETIENLVAGTYTLKELTAPTGYLKANDMNIVVTNTQDSYEYTLENKPISITIEKRDQVTNALLKDAVLALYNQSGIEIQRFATTSYGYVLKKIPVGTYTLKEITAPSGYLKAVDMQITVKNEDGQTFVMYDQPISNTTDVTIYKIDGITGESLSGATFTMTDATGRIIDKWTSDRNGHTIQNVAYGRYTIKENSAPDGYIKCDDVYFDVSATNKTITIKNYYNEVHIYKYETNTKDFVEGAVLHVEDKKGNEVDTWTTKDEKHVITKLKSGKYKLIEDKAPDGYEKASDIEFEVEDGEITKVKMYDKKTTTTSSTFKSESGTVIGESSVMTPEEIQQSKVVATGDNNHLLLYALLGTISIATIAFIYFRKKNK